MLRLVLYASLAWMSLGLAGTPTIAAKGGGCIDPNGGWCRPPGEGAAADDVDRGWPIDPNGS
jgi:hypothetical protein